MIKPMRAEDAVLEKLRFPLIIQPKIDGVRAVYLDNFSARTLKPFANKHVRRVFSNPIFRGLDGELAADEPTHPDLCRMTTSAVTTIEGAPSLTWWCFDYVTEGTITLPYSDRLDWLKSKVYGDLADWVDVRFIPYEHCDSLDDLLVYEEAWLDAGFEGLIIRDPNGKYKQGRSTVREQGLLRLKRFIEEDAVILGFEEAEENLNEAKINALGRTERSSHQANKRGKGMVGTIIARDVKTGDEIRVGPGTLKHEERIAIFQQQDRYIGHQFKYKQFPKGRKDKPRFPTFFSWRPDFDK